MASTNAACADLGGATTSPSWICPWADACLRAVAASPLNISNTAAETTGGELPARAAEVETVAALRAARGPKIRPGQASATFTAHRVTAAVGPCLFLLRMLSCLAPRGTLRRGAPEVNRGAIGPTALRLRHGSRASMSGATPATKPTTVALFCRIFVGTGPIAMLSRRDLSHNDYGCQAPPPKPKG